MPSTDPPARKIFGVPVRDLVMLWRLVWWLTMRRPRALWPFIEVFCECVAYRPHALSAVGQLTAFYLHVGPFSRFVISAVDRQIAEIDTGEWQSPLIVAVEHAVCQIAADTTSVASGTADTSIEPNHSSG